MNNNYFELFLDKDSKIPCYFADSETNEILYLNEPMKWLLNISNDSFLGKSDLEFIYPSIETYDGSPLNDDLIKPNEFSKFKFFLPLIDSYITCYATLIEYEGKMVKYVKFFESDSNYNQLSKMSFQTAVLKCVEILFTKEKQHQPDAFVKLLGEYYDCDRSYYYITNTKTSEIKESFDWVNENFSNELVPYFGQSLEMSFINWASTGSHLEELTLNLTKDTQIQIPLENLENHCKNSYNSLTICPTFSKQGELKTILGLLNRNRSLDDIEYSLLKMVAQFIEMSNALYNLQLSRIKEQIDPLTGAFTREKHNSILQILKREQPKDVGVAFINVNGLKKTNQYYGLEAGDKLIKDSMQIAKEFFKQPWYRLSGDEFLCFVTDLTEEEFQNTLSSLHNKLSNMPQRLFALGSAWKSRTNDIDKLVETADTMMIIDKQTYYTEFDPTKIEFSDHILQDLLLALQEEEFMVYLQPKFNLQTEKLAGAEALIRRFSKKQNKMIFPDQFIPLYEKKSIIRHVDLFVLRKVCMLLQEWNCLGQKLKVSVNLSRVTLLEHGIVHKFAEICNDYQIDYNQIVIEVTERVGLIENEVESPLIEQFKQYGFTISLDDFGCAYSNIVTLAKISVDEVKIDKSLVDNILTNAKNKTIVENMIRMVDAFGNTTTLAEGVETKEQADCLRECNCQYVQGYYYSRPIPTEEFCKKYIENNNKEEN